MEVHQACQSASTSKTAADKASVPGWQEFQSSIHGLADEARQAAPADLFPSEPMLTSEQPSSAVQQQQLLCITQVAAACIHNTHKDTCVNQPCSVELCDDYEP